MSVRRAIPALLALACLLAACGRDLPATRAPSPTPVPRAAAVAAPASATPTSAPTAPASRSDRPRPSTSAPPASPSPSAPPSAARPRATPSQAPLAARLSAAIAAAPAAGPIGVAVVDETGAVVFAHDATQPLLPASTLKLVTAAAALAALGPDHRYETRVAATAAPRPDGTVPGDLVLIGSGDPALATALFAANAHPQRPRTPLEALADAIVATGVRVITGGIYGDPTVFADQPAAPGWKPSYFDDLHATRVSGLTAEGGRKLEFRGGRLQGSAALDPAAEAAASLLTLLAERGVRIDGGVTSTRTPPPVVTELAAVTSPPLRDLLAYAVQHSDNHTADAVFRTLGVAAGDPTWDGSAAAARRALAPLRLDWSGAVLADGSGLSRVARLSPAFLATLLQRMDRSSASSEWAGLLAVSGERGTLRGRLLATAAEHRLRGKTGSLEDVRALAGTVVGPPRPAPGALTGRAYHFAVLANQPREHRVALRDLQDEVVRALAEDLYGCVPVLETPSPTAALPSPSPVAVLRCAA
jgi:D-alanyl-D-alanine carboxypeptidase/D-alanyl-D-alanine-endopeptidase (penicillin-binding protein 4)